MDVSVVKAPLREVEAALREELVLLRPRPSRKVTSWEDARTLLAPLKSIPTRYMCIEAGPWVRIVLDARGENSNVFAQNVGRRLRALVVTVVAKPLIRALYVFNAGEMSRVVQCYWDDDAWVFYERGTVQPCEKPEHYAHRNQKERFPTRLAETYLQLTAPDVLPQLTLRGVDPINAIVFERSLEGLMFPVTELETLEDL